MAVSLEYLHAKEDIPEFIVFLYSIGSYIRHRENPYICQDILSQDRAVNALIDDLSASFGTYYIGKGNNAELLSLDSCGRQGHPRNLGRRGRFAGRIICDNKDDSEAMELFRQIRNYFRRTYNYQRYNGNARMSCYFGPHYQRLDNKYAIHPDAEGVCPGYLRIICREMHKESVSNLVAGVFSEYKAAIPYVSSEWCNYWQDTNLLELRVELLYHSSMIDYDKFLKIACVLHESSYIVNAKNCKLYMSAPAYYPLDMVKNDGRKRIFFIMEHPR